MTDAEQQFDAVVATELERMKRLAAIGDRGTAGPHDAPPAAPTAHAAHPRFVDGWWSGAKRVDAHPGRIGGHIDPICAVLHATDMHPDDFAALVKHWRELAGDGACANFLFGRDATQGVLQLAPILRNGNHAGGPGHGVFTTGGQSLHPNVASAGIEMHCAGGMLRFIGGLWRFVEDGKIHGAPIAADDVEPDPQRPGRGWHKYTPYQLEQWALLREDLDVVMRAAPSDLRAVSLGEQVPKWGVPKHARFSAHVSLDPEHRADVWPNGMRDLGL